MEMSKSDVLDKYSILAMKVRFDATLLPMFKEFEAASSKIVTKYGKKQGLMTAIMTLMEANAKIWLLEATIRNQYKNDPANTGKPMDLQGIGSAALFIREHNALRILAKNRIDEIFGVAPEPKIDHVSIMNVEKESSAPDRPTQEQEAPGEV